MKFLFSAFCMVSISILFSCRQEQARNDYNNSNFGYWERDQNDLPCFVLNFRKQQLPGTPFGHLMSTGNIMVLTNQWGTVNFYENRNGLSNLTPSYWSTRGGFIPMIKIGDELISLLISELDTCKLITYGIGYTKYSGEIKRGQKKHFRVEYEIRTPFDFSDGFHACISIENLSNEPLEGKLMARSETWMKPDYARFSEWEKKINGCEKIFSKGISCFANIDTSVTNLFFLGDTTWIGSNSNHALQLSKWIRLSSEKKESGHFYVGFGTDVKKTFVSFLSFNPNKTDETWKKILNPVQFNLPEKWMDDECLWTYSQLLSFCSLDGKFDERYINLGGYGMGFDASEPSSGFGIREIAEDAMILAYFNPSLAKSSLRWVAQTQSKGGDLIRGTKRNLRRLASNQRLQPDFPSESDTEIWFLMACGEYVKTTGDAAFLNEQVNYLNNGESGTIWDHLKATYSFIRNDVGVGSRGLIRMLHGDWNDYLSKVGKNGNGQSVMNTAMACRAYKTLRDMALIRSEPELVRQIDQDLFALQKAVSESYDTGWFIRAYDDNDNPVGGFSDRLFIEAQIWSVLGGCGTKEQRRNAILNTLKLNSTPIGVTNISKPYSSPAPENISWSPIPAGEGENAGIWPQTVYWLVWAMAEEGMTDLAIQEWKKMTLRNHTRLFPDVPFGVINGPDCYSSKFAGEREGWTQVEQFNRQLPIPMNPVVAWQAFAMKKILESKKR